MGMISTGDGGRTKQEDAAIKSRPSMYNVSVLLHPTVLEVQAGRTSQIIVQPITVLANSRDSAILAASTTEAWRNVFWDEQNVRNALDPQRTEVICMKVKNDG